ncbi:MAG: hypothetical protein J6Y86_07400 [Pseudobutyrivibrio sp.]|nr:hypothetical protein [Pseudobutyrivibrio sp.]
MAISYGFYNSVNHDRQYDAIQFGQVFDGIIKDGVYETYKKAFIVKASNTAGYVTVQPGRAWFNHTWTYNDADLPVRVLDSEVVLDRIDALVIDINSELSERQNTLQWVKGTPSSTTPVKPGSFEHTDTHNQYPICYVYRHSDSDTVAQDDIENAVGTSLCPFVTGVIEGLDIDDLILQWKAQFNTFMARSTTSFNTWMANTESDFFTWMENEKADYAEFLDHNNTAWTTWFSHLQDELDSNQAAHLQAQIDAISFMYVNDECLFLPNTAASVADETLVLTNHN